MDTSYTSSLYRTSLSKMYYANRSSRKVEPDSMPEPSLPSSPPSPSTLWVGPTNYKFPSLSAGTLKLTFPEGPERPALSFKPRQDHAIEHLLQRPAIQTHVFGTALPQAHNNYNPLITQDDLVAAFLVLGDRIESWSNRFFLGHIHFTQQNPSQAEEERRNPGFNNDQELRGHIATQTPLWNLARWVTHQPREHLISTTHGTLWAQSFIWKVLCSYVFGQAAWAADARAATTEGQGEGIDLVRFAVERAAGGNRTTLDEEEEDKRVKSCSQEMSNGFHHERAASAKKVIQKFPPGKTLQNIRDAWAREVLAVLKPFKRGSIEVSGWEAGLLDILDDALEFDIITSVQEDVVATVVWHISPETNRLLYGQVANERYMDLVSVDEQVQVQRDFMTLRGFPWDTHGDIHGKEHGWMSSNREDEDREEDDGTGNGKEKKVTLVVRPGLWCDGVAKGGGGGRCRAKMRVSTKQWIREVERKPEVKKRPRDEDDEVMMKKEWEKR